MTKDRSRPRRFSIPREFRLASALLLAATLQAGVFAAHSPAPSSQTDPFYRRTFIQGEKALLDGDYAAAAEAMEIARFGLKAGDPASVKALLYLSICRFSLNDRVRSREDLSTALRSLNGRELAELDLHPWIRSSLDRILESFGLSPEAEEPVAAEARAVAAPDLAAAAEPAAKSDRPSLPSPDAPSLADLERERRLRPDDRGLALALVEAYAKADKQGPARNLARSLAAADPGDPEAAFWSAKLDYMRRDFKSALAGFNRLLGPAFAARRDRDIDRRSRIYAVLCLHRLGQAASVKTYLAGFSEFVNAPELDRVLAEEGLATAWQTMKAQLGLKSR